MPQETNLNVSPYFDDFDSGKNYHKVLFKPGYPVQARELTTLQSILQDQVEKFGTHFFKEGSKVIPGQTRYRSNFFSVEINSDFLGVPVSLYLNELVGKKIRGQNSGIRAKIEKVITSDQSERGNITLYVDYLESSTEDLVKSVFDDNEVLVSETAIKFGNTFISENQGFASTILANSTSTGSAFSISNGVYFIRGTFVNVLDEILILDQYTNTPNYRVGLLVNEEIVTADEDTTLADNAQGYNNYSAPGADRLKITTTLTKKPLTDFNDTSFVPLATIENGRVRISNNKNTQYNLLADEFARRTYDESGHYYVKPFKTYCKESLDNGLNNGIFRENALTYQGNVPSDDLAVYKISPGKAYVKGYEVEFNAPTFLDVPKPRTTKTEDSKAVKVGFGPTLSLNTIKGAAGSNNNAFGNFKIVSLYDSRIDNNTQIYNAVNSAKEIGRARMYDIALESGSYDATNLYANIWDTTIIDVDLQSDLTLNEAITITTPKLVTGKYTGATGFLKYDVTAGTAVTVYSINGEFSEKEPISFGSTSSSTSAQDDEGRFITDITNYSLSDVQSFSVGSGGIMNVANVVQIPTSFIGNSEITGESAGVSTITVNGSIITGIVTTGNLVQYTQSGITSVTYAKVTSVDVLNKTIEINAVSNVAGVNHGDLPTSDITVNDLQVLSAKLPREKFSGNTSSNKALFSDVPNKNVKSVDLENSEFIFRKDFIMIIDSNGDTGYNTADVPTDSTFMPFDEERYILIDTNGNQVNITADNFESNAGLTQVKFTNTNGAQGVAYLTATLKQTKVKSKIKRKKIVESIIINKSSNASSQNEDDGLSFGNYPYGTRVQDKEICLNYPDGHILYGVFESRDTSDPVIPSATINKNSEDLIIGETIIGRTSNAKAIYLEQKSGSSIGFVYQDDSRFKENEIVDFTTSNVNAVINSIDIGSNNIIDSYKFNSGQKLSFYDYSRIIRKEDAEAPKGKLKVLFSRYFYDSSDTGHFTTVNSYDGFDYGSDIPSIEGKRLTDIIDFRPRVSDYTVSEGSRSPFEFDGRSISTSSSDLTKVMVSDESIPLKYDYYLPRIDRISLTKDKTFVVNYGTPSDNPQPPANVDGGMNIANVHLPPYLFNSSDAKVEFVKHKRYQMKDIFRLENRIKNLEEYSTLSLLETDTKNLFVDDGTGTNRFKSGFYVDNFTTRLGQDNSIGVRNSVDPTRGILRPSHYTTNVELEVGNETIIGDTIDVSKDKRYSSIFGSNIKRSGDVISLDYTDVSWINQPFATRTENVTPFLVKTYFGSIKLDPTADQWIDTKRLQLNSVEMEGSFLGVAEALNSEITTNADGERLGDTGVVWGSWETTGIDLNRRVDTSTSANSSTDITRRKATLAEFQASDPSRADRTSVPNTFRIEEATTTTDTATTTTTTTDITASQRRSGRQQIITEQIDTESLGDAIKSSNIVRFMRSRNIEFTSRGMKPFTQVFPFFDGVDVSRFCISKLIEIEMISGTFEVGEKITTIVEAGTDLTWSGFGVTIEDVVTQTAFRVAQSNHKYGPYNNPTDTFVKNPYNRTINIPELYSTTSTLLNIDTYSLADESTPQFKGNILNGMRLVGETSKAEARVVGKRLVTDRVGTIIGSFFVPSGNGSTPSFETGISNFKLTSSDVNSQIPGVITTLAEESFYSSGTANTIQETTLSLRNARVDTNDSFSESRQLTDSSSTSSTSVTTNVSTTPTGRYVDPLAQSFEVPDESGVFVSKLDLFFRTKDESLPVRIQLRTMELGLPTQKILPFSEVELIPENINLSEDGTVATTVTFESPVYLEGLREYAIVILSDSNEYNVWISQLGEFDVSTLSSEKNQSLVTTQSLLGSLFKSQNASTWTPSQYEDLKFELYRCEFVSSGFTQLFNSNLSESKEVTINNPLNTISQRVIVGFANTFTNDEVSIGLTAVNSGVNASDEASGIIVAFGSSIAGELTITNPGSGYTNGTFSGVTLNSLSGDGLNATADITISNNVAVAATISSGGFGYFKGEVLTPGTNGPSFGSGMQLSVGITTGNNSIILDNITGELATNRTIKVINSSGISTDFIKGTEMSPSNLITKSDGLTIKVFHRNHGLNTSSKATLKNIRSDVPTTKLTSNYPGDPVNTGTINISSNVNFTTYEGEDVAANNPGFVRIGDEILKYTGTTSTTLTGVVREQLSTIAHNYGSDTPVEKYELAGVSLCRINRDHDLSIVDETLLEDPIGPNHYHIKIDISDTRSGTLVDRSVSSLFRKLRLNSSKKSGGSASIDYNIVYEAAIPNIKQISPAGTNINSSIRTVTGKSINGSEVPYVDKGYQELLTNSINYFDSPRLIASRTNETQYLSDIPGKKSITVNLDMETTDTRISPVVDLSMTNITLINNIINSPISNYSTDPRVNSINEDPNKFMYVSNEIRLENSATSIKVILDGYISVNSDIRVFYSIGENSNTFVPFPGYSNIDSNDGSTIDVRSSDGSPDILTVKQDRLLHEPKFDDFISYEFTATELGEFKNFKIKIIGTTTNQAYPPLIRNLRSIALA
jgi:hypothetical protein